MEGDFEELDRRWKALPQTVNKRCVLQDVSNPSSMIKNNDQCTDEEYAFLIMKLQYNAGSVRLYEPYYTLYCRIRDCDNPVDPAGYFGDIFVLENCGKEEGSTGSGGRNTMKLSLGS